MTTYVINDKKVTDNTEITYTPNPKRAGKKAWERYEAYGNCSTVGEYFETMSEFEYENGGKISKSVMTADLRYDLSKGFLTIEDEETE